MLGHLLAPAGIGLDVMAPDLLAGEVVRDAHQQPARVIVVGALPPGGVAHARYLVKHLRAAQPQARIVVGHWCVRDDVEALRTALGAAGAGGVATSLLETRDLVVHLARLSERAA
jgi:methylmalonyl-CoA mutase cobalamin-binding subunit